MGRHAAIIANRGAGSFSAPRLDRVCKSLHDAGIEPEQLLCRDFAEMEEAARTVSSGPEAPLVIAAGGDGTINAVFNGLAGNRATCSILPMGTANVLALELGLQTEENAVARIIAGDSRPFTAGLLSDATRSRRFFLMAGAGLDGQIVRGVTLARKKRFGKGAYLLAGLEQLVRWEGGRLRVVTENAEFSCHSIIICNTARYGGAFTLAPAASIFSPTLDLVAVTGSSRMDHLRLVGTTLAGSRGNEDGIVRIRARRLRIEGVRPLQADGDDWGDTPVEISAEPDYARIIC